MMLEDVLKAPDTRRRGVKTESYQAYNEDLSDVGKVAGVVSGHAQKTAIVCSGGGVRSAYAIGALHALAEVHGITQPAIGVASSGGAAPLLYYLCGLFDHMHKWPDQCAERAFYTPLRFWRPLDIDYLVDHIYKDSVPDLPERLTHTSCDFFIAATEYETGTRGWFTRDDIPHIYEALRATKAVVGMYGKTVNVQGTEYVDGSFSADTNALIEKAYAESAERVIVIDNSAGLPRDIPYAQHTLRLYSHILPQQAGVLMRRFADRTETALPTEYAPLIISRKETLAVRHVFDTNRARMHQAVQEGWEDTSALTL